MTRRLIALCCVALVVLSTVAPGSSHVSGVLEPLSPALHPVATLVVGDRHVERPDEQPAPFLVRLFPRPPPVPSGLA